MVEFTREFELRSELSQAIIHFSADTRYKLFINDERIAVGPARSSLDTWYYDTLDVAKHLKAGKNVVRFLVVRYFAASRHAMPFVRTAFPGLTVVGVIEDNNAVIDLSTGHEWVARLDSSVEFPTGLVDDVFLHVSCAKHVINPTSLTATDQ